MPRTKVIIFVGLLLLIAACSSKPQILSISESQLQQHISRELSVPITLLKIFDIHLSNPIVRLDQASGRMQVEIETNLSNPLSSESLNGTFLISGRLGFDSMNDTIMLYDTRIENVDIGDATQNSQYDDLLNLFASQLGRELLSNIPLYKFDPDELRYGSRHYYPEEFQIIDNELNITLRPRN